MYPFYTMEVIEKYKDAITIGLLPPHVYEISKCALQELNNSRKPQSILITGESGSGKTEACK